MDYTAEISDLLSSVLSIPRDIITDKLSFQSIHQWDSLGHVSLVIAIEKHFCIKIDQDEVLELTSVEAINTFLIERISNSPISETSIKEKEIHTTTPHIHRGLNGVYFDTTFISYIDPENSNLYYRGYQIGDIIENCCYEEVAYLLIYDSIPSQFDLEQFKYKLESVRPPSAYLEGIAENLKKSGISISDRLTVLVSALSTEISNLSIDEQLVHLLGKIPTLIGLCHMNTEVVKKVSSRKKMSHAEYLLHLCLGSLPDKRFIKTFETNLIIQAEHGANASTFSARVSTSTNASIGNSINAAISTFVGDLHGGALNGVVQMLQEIKDENMIDSYILDRLDRKLPIFGFGHRVYRGEDPRAKYLKKSAETISNIVGNKQLMRILDKIKISMSAYAEHGININVDFYACISFLLMSIKKEFLVPVFISSRTAGWLAHSLEQKSNNILIRPRLKYGGELKIFKSKLNR